MHFDLTQISRKAKVKKAYLKLYLFGAVHSKTGPELEAFEVLKPWAEGRGKGPFPRPKIPTVVKGEATWVHSSYPEKWAEKGAGKPGVDRGEKSAGRQLEKSPVLKSWVTIEIDPALVQKWISDPKSNLGIVLKTVNESRHGRGSYRSSEFSDPVFRPKLILGLSTK
jgi:hypothetical protein